MEKTGGSVRESTPRKTLLPPDRIGSPGGPPAPHPLPSEGYASIDGATGCPHRAPAVRAAYFFSASFRRRFPAFFFLCLRRRISRFRSVVIFFSVAFPREDRADIITKTREER